MTNDIEVARVTYVTQFCVSVSFSRPGHIRDPILCICVYLCICDPETKFHKNTQRDPRDPVTPPKKIPKKKPCDPRDQRDPVTQKQNSTKKHNVIHVTSVTLCPLIVARVTYVTQFCVSVCIRVSVTYISDVKEYNVTT